MVNKIRGRGRRVEIRCDDPSQTSAAGLLLVSELDNRLGVVDALDAHIGAVKQRRRGVTGGELVMSWAEMMLAGGDFMCDLDTMRADVAGARLRTVAEPPAPTTAAELARRFDEGQLAGIERALAEVTAQAVAMLPGRARTRLLSTRPTIDIDPTDVEVYGSDKDGVGRNHEGTACIRPCPATWAEAGVALAAELLAGDEDPRPVAPKLVARAIAALPAGLGRPRVRADAGLFDGALARAAVAAGADFAIAAKRNPAIWRAIRAIPATAWRAAKGMRGAQAARIDYAPAGWPAGTYAVVRRVRMHVDDISADPRSRRRRTIDPDQLRLALAGELDYVYAYSIIVTNISDMDTVTLEAWFRERAQVEERIKDSKGGMALRHLPSGYAGVNAVWMWAALAALNISAWLQALTGIDEDGRAHGKRLRRELIRVPGRVVRTARKTILRLAPDRGYFEFVYQQLRALPAAPG